MKKLMIALTMLSLPLFAEHGAHEHGVGELSITVEGNKVKLDLDIPAESIFFEHEAKTKEDKKLKTAAIETLKKDANKFFVFDPKVACRLNKSEVQEEVHKGGHADIEAEWKFDCQKTISGSELEVLLQASFPKITTLRIKVNSDILKDSLVSKEQKIKIKL